MPAPETEYGSPTARRRTASTEENVADLIARCVAGDPEAQACLYTGYNGLVERAVARRWAKVTGTRPPFLDVEDIRDEVFARLLWDNCQKLRCLKEPEAIDAWLMTVAGNYTVDYLRKRFRNGQVRASMVSEAQEPYGSNPEDAARAKELSARVAEGLAKLVDRDRLILELFYVQGLRYAEIADIVGLNINTMAARLRRGKEKLRRLLEGSRDELT